MSPRHSAAEAARTRERIIERGLDLASVEGLEGLTIGRLAAGLGISKSGLLGHFGTKQALQLAALERAAVIFNAEVWRPAAGAAPGLPRLRAVCDAWISYLTRGVFPGGCLFVSSTFEQDGRSGPVRALLQRQFHAWNRRLTAEVRTAVANGGLPRGTDPAQLVFELYGVMMSLNHAIQLHGDHAATTRATTAVARLLPREGPAARPAQPASGGKLAQ
ncbi:TetR/AcrR family transcriptional regulator [Streptomyces sp. MP131-18]|uniref:TetR/AcrR family transcriptional regulator n=1 Tax=Streptomyces sp. MP131-18 TaxID=1857892 RepID=UPI00097C9CB2|nr:TetR/AcrR family transcriptional regulator [Streptomyces sp. MP131-18]ONK14669.1 Bacterial regulatory protein, tetR family [Streptomyces sp. MP131-18]